MTRTKAFWNLFRSVFTGKWISAFISYIYLHGWEYVDVKRDKTGKYVTAFTVSNDKDYIDKVAQIE